MAVKLIRVIKYPSAGCDWKWVSFVAVGLPMLVGAENARVADLAGVME